MNTLIFDYLFFHPIFLLYLDNNIYYDIKKNTYFQLRNINILNFYKWNLENFQ
jgi:hypothetical protein